jgi:lysophospholipid acyltransferase (LPLAT)-like uncharacterized protein
MKGAWRYAAAGRAGGLLLDALLGTARIERINPEAFRVHRAARRPIVFALWHGQLLPPTWLHRHEDMVTLASRSADGEYIARVLHHWGYHVVRGSSSRGGESALRELVRLIRAGRSVAITADGPRGPSEKLKLGVLHMAQLTGAALVPVGTAASRAWRFRSWDRFLLPKPFARIRIAYGDALSIPRDTDAAGLAAHAEVLEQKISELARLAEAALT